MANNRKFAREIEEKKLIQNFIQTERMMKTLPSFSVIGSQIRAETADKKETVEMRFRFCSFFDMEVFETNGLL